MVLLYSAHHNRAVVHLSIYDPIMQHVHGLGHVYACMHASNTKVKPDQVSAFIGSLQHTPQVTDISELYA